MKNILVMITMAVHATVLGQHISQNDKDGTVCKITEMLSNHYVLIDTGQMMIDRLTANLKNGSYDSIISYSEFADRLTTDLKSVYPDKHMGVFYKKALKEQRQTLFIERNKQQYELKILEGNIGYFDLNTFLFHDSKGNRIIKKAIKHFKNTSAIIIDVRNNRGGNANMAHYLAGQFLPPNSLISTVYKRKRNELRPVKRYISIKSITAWKRTDILVYVLIDERTASAGEIIAYHLQAFGRGTIVGENSVGAGHATIKKSINKYFLMLVPNEKMINCATKSDWEHVGVIPDIEVSSELALQTALRLIN